MVTARLEAAGSGIRAAPISIEQFHRALLSPLHRLHRDLVLLTRPTPLVPALFVIGDSTFDVGTNNYLGTLARADREPYGRDFDTHRPTGRFSNGRIPVDYLAEKMGLPFVPTYLEQSMRIGSGGVGLKRRELAGRPGTWGGLCLRLGQAALAAASLAVMFNHEGLC
ncbi:GDSL esterase/lipase At2g04020-like [Triticum aestivum]|uniref:GDSL esterase/lipase At2g04020-like n=1 Tax=Triticum aestivum TaxID=4565 RepID=UPI001D028074|nr:GDSL esterase/lipase At2g04020-like [Triticum aestivum]